MKDSPNVQLTRNFGVSPIIESILACISTPHLKEIHALKALSDPKSAVRVSLNLQMKLFISILNKVSGKGFSHPDELIHKGAVEHESCERVEHSMCYQLKAIQETTGVTEPVQKGVSLTVKSPLVWGNVDLDARVLELGERVIICGKIVPT